MQVNYSGLLYTSLTPATGPGDKHAAHAELGQQHPTRRTSACAPWNTHAACKKYLLDLTAVASNQNLCPAMDTCSLLAAWATATDVLTY